MAVDHVEHSVEGLSILGERGLQRMLASIVRSKINAMCAISKIVYAMPASRVDCFFLGNNVTVHDGAQGGAP